MRNMQGITALSDYFMVRAREGTNTLILATTHLIP